MFAPVAILFYLFWSLYICYTIAAVNVLFIIVAFFVRPFSRVTARRLNEWMMSHLWPIYGYCLEVLGGTTIRFTGDALPATVNQGNYVVISNHSYYCDWCPITCSLSQRFGRNAQFKLMAKDFIKYIPGVGTGIMGVGAIFLARDFHTDMPKLRRAFAHLIEDKIPFWLYSHPEGSRANPAKLAEARKFAQEKGLTPLDNLLLPRVKGFAASVEALRPCLTGILDITVSYAKRPPIIPFSFFLGFPPSEISLHVRHIPIAELPVDNAGLSRWLYTRWEEKDKLLSQINAQGVFPGPQHHIPMDWSWVRRSMRAWETINVVAWVSLYLAYRILGR
jgi:1-acyl-sn-glycerol-3-phosphate acyltransferase